MIPRRPILHVAPFLWSGAGGVITRLCEDQRRVRPVVLVTTGRGGDLADWPAYRRRLRDAGVIHHSIDLFHRDADVFWASTARLAELLRRLRPCAIHAHAGVPACGAVMAREQAGMRVPVVAQMYSWGQGRPAWMNLQDLWGFARADRVVCSAHAYRKQLRAGGVPASRLVYLPWGLPLDELRCRSSRLDEPAGAGSRHPVRLGFVGRIEPRKGQLALVDAFAVARSRMPGATLELVGPVADDAYAAVLRQRIKSAGLDNVVTLTGMVRDVRRHLAGWDLFVSMSSDEGQGLAVLEAMAIGVPVLARSAAGLDDFLRHGRTGLVTGATAPRALADDIVAALADPARLARVVRGARRLVERDYDWDCMVEEFDTLYRS